jgi:hypothetical protein
MLRAAQRSVPDIMIDDGLQTLGPISAVPAALAQI